MMTQCLSSLKHPFISSLYPSPECTRHLTSLISTKCSMSYSDRYVFLLTGVNYATPRMLRAVLIYIIETQWFRVIRDRKYVFDRTFVL